MEPVFELNETPLARHLPDWVPTGARHYIAHTENGAPIRALARAAGCHASTILRQIRKVEMRRDDPLVDAGLQKLGGGGTTAALSTSAPNQKDADIMKSTSAKTLPDDATLAREAMRILRRLCETGAVLAVAADLEKAVVVRDAPSGNSTRTAVVDAEIAQAMALKDWIAPSNEGRIIRYRITGAGRTALANFLEEFGATAEPATGMAEAGAAFSFGDLEDAAIHEDTAAARSRFAIGESPLSALARRRDKRGEPFLKDALVHAGERLREDFELAQMDPSVAQNWDHFLTAGTHAQGGATKAGMGAPALARKRVTDALADLGPGLSDVALRWCCYLEGLETTEKRLGWSARSGKIVLRIALMRLKRHYDETVGPGGAMIG